MQFKVPQNVQREDTIIGPLTLKQLIVCGIGFTIAYAIYVSFSESLIWLPPVAIVVLITLAFAFLKPLGLNFEKYVLLFIEFALLPKKRLWIKGSGEIVIPIEDESKKDDKKNQTEKSKRISKQEQLKNIQEFLDKQKTE